MQTARAWPAGFALEPRAHWTAFGALVGMGCLPRGWRIIATYSEIDGLDPRVYPDDSLTSMYRAASLAAGFRS